MENGACLIFTAKLGQLFVELSADPAKLNAAITSAQQQVAQLQRFSQTTRADLQKMFAAQHTAEAARAAVNARFVDQYRQSLSSPEGQRALAARGREDLARETMQAREKTEAARNYVRVLNSPEGRRFLEEQARAHRELNRFEAARKWRELVVEQGRFGAGLTVIGQKLDGIGRGAAVASAFGIGAIGGLTRAASPAHFATLSGQFERLAAIVGRDFLPRIAEASRLVQEMGNAWERQPAAVRTTAADVAMFTASAAVGVALLQRLFRLGSWGVSTAGSLLSGGASLIRAGEQGTRGIPNRGQLLGRAGLWGSIGFGAMGVTQDVLDRMRGRPTRPWWGTALNALFNGIPGLLRMDGAPGAQPAAQPRPAFARDTAPGRAELLAREAGRVPRGRPARSGLLTDFGPFEPERGGFEDQWWRIQMAASRFSPLRADIRQRQFENMGGLLGGRGADGGGGGGGGGVPVGEDPVVILRDIRDAVQVEARRRGGMA